jgi:hypothetical protein
VAGPTSKPFIKAFACAGVLFATVIVAAWAFLGPPGDTLYASHLAGRLFAAVALAALATGFLARRSAKEWHMARISATYVVALVIIVALYAVGMKGR